MAGTLRANVTLSATYGALSARHARTFDVTTTGDHCSGQVQDVGFAAHEALDIPAEIGTAGLAYFHNMDATNFVQLGRDVTGAFVDMITLLPGESALVRLSTDAIYAKADTAAVKLFSFVTEA